MGAERALRPAGGAAGLERVARLGGVQPGDVAARDHHRAHLPVIEPEHVAHHLVLVCLDHAGVQAFFPDDPAGRPVDGINLVEFVGDDEEAVEAEGFSGPYTIEKYTKNEVAQFKANPGSVSWGGGSAGGSPDASSGSTASTRHPGDPSAPGTGPELAVPPTASARCARAARRC